MPVTESATSDLLQRMANLRRWETWAGAYHYALSQGWDEGAAAYFADAYMDMIDD